MAKQQDQTMRIGAKLEDDPVQRGLKDLEKQIQRVESKMKQSSRTGKKGAEEMEQATKKHGKALDKTERSMSSFSSLAKQASGALAAAFSVQAVTSFIKEVQAATEELANATIEAERLAAANTGLSPKNRNVSGVLQKTVTSAFNQEQRAGLAKTITQAVGPVTEEDERKVLEITNEALKTLPGAVGGQKGFATAERIAEVAGTIARQEKDISAKAALDIAANAIKSQGDTKAVEGIKEQASLFRQVAPNLTPEQRITGNLQLSALGVRGGIGVEGAGQALNDFALLQKEIEIEGRSGNIPSELQGIGISPAFRNADPIAGLFQLLQSAAAGNQQSIATADRVFSTDSRKIIGEFQKGDFKDIARKFEGFEGTIAADAASQPSAVKSRVETEAFQVETAISQGLRTKATESKLEFEEARQKRLANERARAEGRTGVAAQKGLDIIQGARRALLPDSYVAESLQRENDINEAKQQTIRVEVSTVQSEGTDTSVQALGSD